MSAYPALDGLTVLERGWLSSNNILIHPAAGETGALLVDTGHVNHAAQTLALVRHALGGQALTGIVNTHLHSDHCGGNATLQQALGAPVHIPPGHADAVATWDEAQLSYRATGQRVDRFAAQRVLVPGQPLHAAGRRWPGWQVLAAPGHDPHSTMLFNEDTGVLLSADALWGNGFGVVFPEVEGEPGFDDVEAVLDLIAGLPVKVVVPGHGAPFADVAAALDRARSRLAAFRASPERHARYAFKVLVKYHLMEEGAMAEADLMVWARATPLLAALLQGQGGVDAAAREGWGRALVDELVAQGAAERKGGILVDA
jgi:glyoxylase-like metal-dependent hydrolase (beta-lactamase superfamily II)